jgi:hypothetical protein
VAPETAKPRLRSDPVCLLPGRFRGENVTHNSTSLEAAA